MEFLKDLFNFMMERKKFWLAPIILILILLGVLIAIGGGSAAGPFIYTLFQPMQKMKSNPPKTVLTICVGFLLIYARWSYDWILMATIVIGLAAVFSDKLSRRIEQAWMKLAWALGEVIPKITLTPVFYLLLFPIALISRVFGPKDPMHIKSSGDSLFKDVDKSFDKKSFENPW